MNFKQLRERAAIGAVTAGIMFGGMATAVAAQPNHPKPVETEKHQESYWEDQGYGECEKVEDPANPFVVPAPDAGNAWTYLILKSASGSAIAPGEVVYDVIPNPIEGESYTHMTGKGISFAIICQDDDGGYPES